MPQPHVAIAGTLGAIFDFEDLSGTYAVADVTLALALSLVLTVVVGYVYRATHRGTSYTQSYVQTLVMMGVIVSLVMLIVGSNLARAFSLVGALSIIRFRNAVKETRDVGYLFLAMAIGMATGTRFYTLAIVATVVLSLAMLIMNRFDMFKMTNVTQILKIHVTPDFAVNDGLDKVFLAHTKDANLVSMDSVRSGMLNELVYAVRLKSGTTPADLLRAVQEVNGNQKVSFVTGYDSSDL
jgi:uncharacterized membrane protein YhiD involved in acid resistance